LGCGLEAAFLNFAADKISHGLGLVSDEMESDEHQTRIPAQTLRTMLQRIGFQKFVHERFEFGLNNLMVASR
jgi:hypothetical protein